VEPVDVEHRRQDLVEHVGADAEGGQGDEGAQGAPGRPLGCGVAAAVGRDPDQEQRPHPERHRRDLAEVVGPEPGDLGEVEELAEPNPEPLVDHPRVVDEEAQEEGREGDEDRLSGPPRHPSAAHADPEHLGVLDDLAGAPVVAQVEGHVVDPLQLPPQVERHQAEVHGQEQRADDPEDAGQRRDGQAAHAPGIGTEAAR